MTGVHKTALATTFSIAVLAGWYTAPEARGHRSHLPARSAAATSWSSTRLGLVPLPP